MAGLHTTTITTGGAGGLPGVVYHRADESLRRRALSLLLTGQSTMNDAAVDQFLVFADENKMAIDELWVARRGDELLVTLLLVPAAGRTAMVFMSQLRAETAPALAPLVGVACGAIDPTRTRLVQAILDPWQETEFRCLTQAGFAPLATLIYMTKTLTGASPDSPPERSPSVSSEASPHLSADLEMVRWSAVNRPWFEQGILESYRETLDCPGLLGLRSIDDILAGHMSSGVFHPDLWIALLHQRKAVGVMLLSVVPTKRAAELVYLGLAPEWRGKGLGRQLVRLGEHLIRQRGAASFMLAVDDRNTPAMKLYRSLDFFPHARKKAMILPMPEAK